MNTLLLKSKMALKEDTFKTLAKAIGISESGMYLKLRDDGQFTQNEIKAMKNRYNLTDKEVVDIFFAD